MIFRRSAHLVYSPLGSDSLCSLPAVHRGSVALACVAAIVAFSVAPHAHADTIGNTIVSAQTSVYATATNTYGGTAEVVIPIAAGTTQVTFTVTETGGPNTVTVNSGGNYNDPDGVGSATGETNTGTSDAGHNLSAITTPGAGFLAGVFTDGTDAEVATALNYTTTSSTSAGSYTPTLDQVFFIGDGLTGDGTGSTQIFYVPTGTTMLSLGLSDACNYYGAPSCLSDNSGSFTVSYDEKGAAVVPPSSTAATPEPSSLVLIGTGAVGLVGSLRRRSGARK